LRLDLTAEAAEGIEVVGKFGAEREAVAGHVDGVDRPIEIAAVEM